MSILDAVLKDYERGLSMTDYFTKRGITPETAKKFRLGYAGKGSKAYAEYGFVEAVESGVFHPDKQGNLNDMFRYRAIFPIFSADNTLIGFGGRAIYPTAAPKYLNSPESEVFKKRENLFGLNLLTTHLPTIVLCEGYFDVISLQQAGIPAVAPLGTALSATQASLLTTPTDEVVIFGDNDDAGRNAVKRSLGILREAGINARVVVNPTAAKDADEVVVKYGGKAASAFVDEAVDGNRWLLDNTDDEKEKAKLFFEIVKEKGGLGCA